MNTKIYVGPYVAGPDPEEPVHRRSASRLAFRICDLEFCERIKSSNGSGLPIATLTHRLEAIDAGKLQTGDLLLVEAGQFVHADGKVRMGAAMVDESAVTGQSSYALCEADGQAKVMRDSLVVSGAIVVEVTPRLGHPLDWIKETDATAVFSDLATRHSGIR